MDKNTIWAILLSTIVIIASYFVLPMVFPGLKLGLGNQQSQTESVAEPAELSLENENKTAATEKKSENQELVEAEIENNSEEKKESLKEEKFTIVTNKAEVVFTNKGGDIISYKLLDHKDMDTDDYVQLADNVNSLNRAGAIAIGKADAKIIDDIFNVEKTYK